MKSNPIGIIVASALTMCGFILPFILINGVGHEDVKSLVIPITLILTLLIYFPCRYVLWNLYGQENIIITTKEIKYWYDYKLFHTSPKTIEFNSLATGFTTNQENDDKILGKFHFAEFSESKEIEFRELFSSSVLISIGDLVQLDIMISELFTANLPLGPSFEGYSLN